MIARFYDSVSGGFFDAQRAAESLGVLATARKPFQDSPTPAGNPMAAIALLRMHGYTDEAGYRDKAEATLELLAGAAGQYGLFAATYGIAAVYFAEPHTQIVVVGEDETAEQLYDEAIAASSFGKSVLEAEFQSGSGSESSAVAGGDDPASAVASREGKICAIVCSNGACQPPAFSVEELRKLLAPARAAA